MILQELLNTHVNLVDLVDPSLNTKQIQKFDDVKGLAKYSRKHGKYFPREEAKAGGVLRVLLRRLSSGKRASDAKSEGGRVVKKIWQL